MTDPRTEWIAEALAAADEQDRWERARRDDWRSGERTPRRDHFGPRIESGFEAD